MQVAGDRATLRTGNPEIGAAGIKDDLELLGRRSEGNRAEVYSSSVSQWRQPQESFITLCVQEVLNRNIMGPLIEVD